MLEKIELKKSLLFWRNSHMQVMLVCLRIYKQTGEQFYMDMAKWLGVKSAQLKKELDNL